MPAKKWLLRKTRKPDYLPLDNDETAYDGPLNDGIGRKRNEINTGVGANDVEPNGAVIIHEQ